MSDVPDMPHNPPCNRPGCIIHNPRPAAVLERQVVFTRDDGSQALVDVWSDGRYVLSEKARRHTAWGPQVTGDVQ